MGLQGVLIVGAGLIGIGLWGALAQKSIVMVLMGFTLMLNGALLSAVAFWHHVAPYSANGQVLALVVLTAMAVQTALGLALVIAVYRARQADTVDDIEDLRG